MPNINPADDRESAISLIYLLNRIMPRRQKARHLPGF
jgi:hypothetical protein